MCTSTYVWCTCNLYVLSKRVPFFCLPTTSPITNFLSRLHTHSFSPSHCTVVCLQMMLTQRISALAHDLARTCHVGGGGGGSGGTTSDSQPDNKTAAPGKTAKETLHRYSTARKRELKSMMFGCKPCGIFIQPSMCVCVCAGRSCVYCGGVYIHVLFTLNWSRGTLCIGDSAALHDHQHSHTKRTVTQTEVYIAKQAIYTYSLCVSVSQV